MEVELANAGQPELKGKVTLLVDSDATHSIISARTLDELKIRPFQRRKFALANGQGREREVGGCVLRVAGQVGSATVIFGEASGQEVLGVTALEEVAWGLDPASRELRPMKLFLV